MKTFKPTFEEVKADFAAYADKQSDARKRKLILALTLAITAHKGQNRKQSIGVEQQPYIIHPIRVMLLLAVECGITNIELLTAALLHDVIEDGEGRITPTMIGKHFGKARGYVKAVTKPAGEMSDDEHQLYYDRIAAAPEAVRLLKLADRVDNLRDVLTLPDIEFQKKQLAETCKYFPEIMEATDSPLCDELTQLVVELEERLA